MARPLVIEFHGASIPLQLVKVTRSALYGYVESETVDDKNRRCAFAKIGSDGKTLVGSGGTAFAMMSAEGEWIEKSKLKPVGPDGNTIIPVKSSFTVPVALEDEVNEASIDEYLQHNVRAVYLLKPEGDAGPLLDALKQGKILRLLFSYRGGLEADMGFILVNADGEMFLCVGKPTKVRFVGLEQTAAAEEEGDAEEEEEAEIDFGMM